MMNSYIERFKEMEFNHVKEAPTKRVPAKRVNIVSVRMVKECSMLYKIELSVVLKMVTGYSNNF